MSKPRIWIEAGHGGTDPGAVANGMRESDITLEVSLHLRDMLQPAFNVGLARDTDINLANRVRRANDFNPDLIFCPHVNAGGGTGVEVVIPSAIPNNIRRDLQLNRQFAQKIAHALGQEFNMLVRRNRGVMLETETHWVVSGRGANIPILRETRAIAVMPEIGFIDAPLHHPDVEILRNRRKDIARVFAKEIYKWFKISWEEVDEMTAEKFDEFMRAWLAGQAAQPPSGWAAKALADAVDAGITDGQRPRSFATREETAIMINRAVNGNGKSS